MPSLIAKATVLGLLCMPIPHLLAQVSHPEVHRVRWPLLDIVMVPDSAGLWFIAGPNPATINWESGSNLVNLDIDPILALQWVTAARQLTPLAGRSQPDSAARVTPALRERKGPGFILLGTNTKKPSAQQAFIILVSDSARRSHWKAFASAAQVDSLLSAVELTAVASQFGGSSWDVWDCKDPDTPVRVVSQPKPAYPSRLADMRRIGRVWVTYVVGADGQPYQESFSPLLSDDSLFTTAALVALRRSRFKPALTAGEPVPQRVFQAIVFRQR